MAAGTERTGDAEPKARIFISYSRKDMAFADRLEAALQARGFEALIDRHEIYAFEDWWKRIEALISQADTVVFVLSPDSVKSDVALKEIAHASILNKRFAPIVCRKVEDAAVPEALRQLNFVFFDDAERFDANVERLAKALRTDIGWIRRHTEFGEAARRWIEAGHPGGMLLRPPILDQAETWLALRPAGAPPATSETETFLTESRKADTESRLAEARSRRRWRRAQAAIYVLLVAIILGLIGWINQDYLITQWRYVTITLPYWYAQVRGHVLTIAQERAIKPGDSFKECAQDCPEMVVVPAGSFNMGGPDAIEQPLHSVTFAMPFAVSKYELTFADWDACVSGGGCNGYRPAELGWGRERQPVINVNWYDAQRYTAWLSRVTGKIYRLLSEAEYEYATRAGTTTVYPWGDDIKLNGQVMANCNGCGSKWDHTQPAPVGSFAPNQFGLYDMIGNVWEWVEDCVHTNYNGAPTDGSAWTAGGNCQGRVVRGGSGRDSPRQLGSAERSADSADNRMTGVGFRVARTLDVR
jgi:formylglycine-generating enzyme required for sulfatase activity